MREINFVKMQGIGNDYVYINSFAEKLPDKTEYYSELAKLISDRHFGVGSDGLILIIKGKTTEYRMRMFNLDGSEAEMCGNGLRCFAKYLFDKKLTEKTEFSVETAAGVLPVKLFINESTDVESIQIKMGKPNFCNTQIPVINKENETLEYPMFVKDKEFIINCVSVGNPHCVIFLDKSDDLKSLDLTKYGPLIENNQMFPNRINVEFVKVISENEAYQRTWERGSGETLACGTGATAVFAVGNRLGKFSKSALIHLLAGNLELSIDDKSEELLLKGPAVQVFSGSYYSPI